MSSSSNVGSHFLYKDIIVGNSFVHRKLGHWGGLAGTFNVKLAFGVITNLTGQVSPSPQGKGHSMKL
eukprot:gene581-1999_t